MFTKFGWVKYPIITAHYGHFIEIKLPVDLVFSAFTGGAKSFSTVEITRSASYV
jgi:hypothetical protein